MSRFRGVALLAIVLLLPTVSPAQPAAPEVPAEISVLRRAVWPTSLQGIERPKEYRSTRQWMGKSGKPKEWIS